MAKAHEEHKPDHFLTREKGETGIHNSLLKASHHWPHLSPQLLTFPAAPLTVLSFSGEKDGWSETNLRLEKMGKFYQCWRRNQRQSKSSCGHLPSAQRTASKRKRPDAFQGTATLSFQLLRKYKSKVSCPNHSKTSRV